MPGMILTLSPGPVTSAGGSETRMVMVALAGALVGGDVGGEAGHHAVEFRCGALVGATAAARLLADLQLVDVLRIDLATTERSSAHGTIMMASPAVMTPPAVCTVDCSTTPSCGARMSMAQLIFRRLRSTNS